MRNIYNLLNMDKQKLTLSNRKNLYLSMMDEIDAFCRKNNIRYSLSCGTLIGAIRHKGFIPWDDDLDIMMPLPDMIKFKEQFHSDNLRYVDVDIADNHQNPFSRIESLKTFSYKWPYYKSFGLCIDLYPIIGLPKRNIEIDRFFFAARKLLIKRCKLNKWKKRTDRFFPIINFRKATKSYIEYRNFMFQFQYGNSGRFYHLGGAPNWAAVLDEDYFDDSIDVIFEGRKYQSISKYDQFLTTLYGDYMQLPPEKDRHPYHGGDYYWK